jgi:hypothetical protein
MEKVIRGVSELASRFVTEDEIDPRREHARRQYGFERRPIDRDEVVGGIGPGWELDVAYDTTVLRVYTEIKIVLVH